MIAGFNVSKKKLEEYFFFLDRVRESGRTNMWGAGTYLSNFYKMPPKKATAILSEWMRTFSERHPKERP